MKENFGFSNLLKGEKSRLNRKIEKNSEEDSIDIDRRDLLKKSVLLTGGALAIGATGGFWTGETKKRLSLEGGLEKMLKMEVKNQSNFAPTIEQENIEREDQKVIGRTVAEQLKTQDRIILNSSTKEAIYEEWRKSYSPEGENYLGLKEALERMRPWINEMKAAFRKHGVPEEFVYLAIPESHFDVSAQSRKNAKGPFQFIESTAKEYDLRVDSIIDERCDPVKSAEACARYLKKSYSEFNNSWNLALADYNGGYTNEYAKFRKNKSERNYEDYLAFRERRINDFIFFDYEIKKGEYLSSVARKFGLAIEDIKRINGLKSDSVKAGQSLKLPKSISDKMDALRESLENLNYPEKFFAVRDVIKENKLEEQYASMPIKYESAETPKSKATVFSCAMEKGEGLFAASRKIFAKVKKINPAFTILRIQNEIQKQNNIKDSRKIPAGLEIKVELPTESRMSLAAIAQKKNIPLEKIVALNPSILNFEFPLPPGIIIRIPKNFG